MASGIFSNGIIFETQGCYVPLYMFYKTTLKKKTDHTFSDAGFCFVLMVHLFVLNYTKWASCEYLICLPEKDSKTLESSKFPLLSHTYHKFLIVCFVIHSELRKNSSRSKT